MKTSRSVRNVRYIYTIVIVGFFLNFKTLTTVGQVIDSDSEQYSDDLYHQLASEYEYELIRTSTKPRLQGQDDQQEDSEDSVWDDTTEALDSKTGDDHLPQTVPKESYKAAIARLKCNNPWFWNSFKCLWLDIRKRNYSARTRSNAITVAWIIGPPLTLLITFLCGFCIVVCYLQARVKQIEKKMNEIRKTYEPGSIRLPDGSVKKYEPTEEEVNAFEDVFSTLVSIV